MNRSKKERLQLPLVPAMTHVTTTLPMRLIEEMDFEEEEEVASLVDAEEVSVKILFLVDRDFEKNNRVTNIKTVVTVAAAFQRQLEAGNAIGRANRPFLAIIIVAARL
jgi:hypothetical protein